MEKSQSSHIFHLELQYPRWSWNSIWSNILWSGITLYHSFVLHRPISRLCDIKYFVTYGTHLSFCGAVCGCRWTTHINYSVVWVFRTLSTSEKMIHQLFWHLPSRIQKTKMIVCYWWCKWIIIKVVVQINRCWSVNNVSSHINGTFLETFVRVMDTKTISMINNALDVETMNNADETHIKVCTPFSIHRLP